MNLQIRFCDKTRGEASTSCFDSCFVFRLDIVNLCNEMTIATKNLDPAKMLMIGIYEPNMNWLIFDKMNGEQ